MFFGLREIKYDESTDAMAELDRRHPGPRIRCIQVVSTQPEWVPMILGLLIIAFSVSLLTKSRPGKGESGRRDE